MAVFVAASCSSSSADAERLNKFEVAITNGASCENLFELGNDITTGSPELTIANELLVLTDCIVNGPSFFAEQTVVLTDATTSTTQAPNLGDTILTDDSASAPTTSTAIVTTTTAPAATTTTLVVDDSAPGFAVEVVAILDANHIRISGGWPVKLIGLATPNACSESSAFSMLSELLPVGTKIGIIYGALEYDNNGNALLYVTRLSDGVKVNATMIANGALDHAPDPFNPLFTENFTLLATQAERLGVGNWTACGFK